MTHFLNNLKDRLKEAGIQASPAIADRLKKAVASKDHGEIIRAFHDAIYGRSQKLSDVLPVVKGYLADADPFVRLTAAETLYTAGDRSGYDTLLGMVTASEAIPDGKLDLRVEAARVLAKFRESDATDKILQLYKSAPRSGLLSELAILDGPEIGVELQRHGYYANEFSIIRYGMLRAPDFSTQLSATFQKTDDSDVKVAAAWALARLGKDEYTNYLVQMAQPATAADPKGNETFDAHSAALRYLGSLQNPQARQVLESALDSNNPVAVQYAVVNLLFNQPDGSEKAKQVVLDELRGTQGKLGTELTLNIAAQLDDPQIRAAGQAFQERAGDKSWQYAIDRKQWPIYNWIDNYVVALKR